MAKLLIHITRGPEDPTRAAKQVQVWLGHHSPAFTLATYVHLLADDLPSVDFLDAVTRGNEGATGTTETGRDDEPLELPATHSAPSEPNSTERLSAVF